MSHSVTNVATLAALGALLLPACTAEEEPASPVPVVATPPTPIDPTDPWVVDGQVGDLTIIRQEANVAAGRTLRVAGVFADDLQGLPWPAACDFADRLCLPADAEFETVYDTSLYGLDPDTSTFSWVGDTVSVGEMAATFDVKPDNPVGGYAGRDLSNGLLLQSYPLSFAGGEWGDFEAEGVVPLPEELTVFYPPPNRPVELGDDSLAQFRWAPTGEGQLVLSMQGPGWSTARIIEDDGEAWIDTSDIRFSRPVDVRLQRVVDAGSITVGANQLDVHAVSEQGWCMYDRCDDQPINGLTSQLVFEFCWSATSCGDSQWILEPDHTWSTLEGYIGDWEYDCCTETIDIFFSSGTHYFGTRDEDGCFVGEMISWSGNQGDWRGCINP